MKELIEVIRIAVTSDATAEQKATGVQACRTIVAALDTEPGKPIVLPGMTMPAPTSRVSVDQVLDLMIGRLTTIAAQREAAAVPAAAPSPRGLHVPVALPRPAMKQLPKRSNPNARKP
jgi:hypothetical protein